MLKTKRENLEAKEVMSRGDRIFDIVNKIILITFSLICTYPLYYIFISSISNGYAVDSGKVLLLPIDPNIASYVEILSDKYFWSSYANTFFYTIFGTMFSMLVSTPAAYVLSKSHFRWRKVINILVVFTMWFNPGFIPLYLNYTGLGAENSRWMIVVSFGIQAFNIILLRNYFEAVPKEIDESAKLDGATDFQILRAIYLPISKPALATVTLYYAMGRWNGYFWATVLLSDIEKIPLQVYIKQKVIDQALVQEYNFMVGSAEYSYTTLIYALVVCSIIPVLIIFPYISKYFQKGVMVGAVKG